MRAVPDLTQTQAHTHARKHARTHTHAYTKQHPYIPYLPTISHFSLPIFLSVWGSGRN